MNKNSKKYIIIANKLISNNLYNFIYILLGTFLYVHMVCINGTLCMTIETLMYVNQHLCINDK